MVLVIDMLRLCNQIHSKIWDCVTNGILKEDTCDLLSNLVLK